MLVEPKGLWGPQWPRDQGGVEEGGLLSEGVVPEVGSGGWPRLDPTCLSAWTCDQRMVPRRCLPHGRGPGAGAAAAAAARAMCAQ